MRAWLAIIAAGLSVAGCSPPHQFDIRSDEPIKSVELDLANMRKSEVTLVSSQHALAVAHAADSSGEIRVLLVNGEQVDCRVRYITNGEAEPHHLVIKDRHCNGI